MSLVREWFRSAVLGSVLCVAFASAAEAEAAKLEDDAWARSWAFALDLGIGAPTGFVGVDVQYSPVRYFSVATGFGVNGEGLQGMLELRPRLPVTESVALTLLGGWSFGPYEEPRPLNPDDAAPTRAWSIAHWANVGLGVEARDHVLFRAFAGTAFLLNVDDGSCDGPEPRSCDSTDFSPRTQIALLGLSLGFAF